MDFTPVINYVTNVLHKEKGVPGCDLKIVQNHKTLLRYSCGYSDYEGKQEVSDTDLYYMYSCTKLVTCVAALQLIEKGIISLEDPVYKYIPSFKNVFLIKGGKRVAPKTTMTLWHLFTMSAGLTYNIDAKPLQEFIAANPCAGTVDIVSAIALSPIDFEPGEMFQYSLCHDVLAAVVEVASGMKFSEYLKQNIFQPLGMNSTAFNEELIPVGKLAAQYQCVGSKVEPLNNGNPFTLAKNYESGGAGLISTVDDFSLFAAALACGGVGANGAKILKEETIRLMATEQLSSYTMKNNFSCAAGEGYGYGLGVRTLIDKSQGQRSSLGEFGWDGAAGSYIMIDPKENLSIFFSMHVRNWPALIGCAHAPIRDLTYDILGL